MLKNFLHLGMVFTYNKEHVTAHSYCFAQNMSQYMCIMRHGSVNVQ